MVESANSVASAEDEDNPFRPSKGLRVEDQSEKDDRSVRSTMKTDDDAKPQSQSASKISFALKSKAAPTSNAAPSVDLTQRTREPLIAPKAKAPPRPAPTEPTPKLRQESRYDRRPEYGSDRRYDYRYASARPVRRVDHQPEARPEPPPRERPVKKVKPRPKLTPDFAASESVYYRKPGNESVVGSGTYGKVFKAVHVYTKSMVALKKIRMEGERDGVGLLELPKPFAWANLSFPVSCNGHPGDQAATVAES